MGRNHLQKSRLKGMKNPGAWGTLFSIERARKSSLSNGLKRQLTRVIPVAGVTAMTELQALL